MTPELSNSAPRLPLVRLGREVVADRQEALEREWLLTNGIGGFAGASLAGANTRRYHGLLVASLQPPLGRTVLLSKLDEAALLQGQAYALDVNEWKSGAASLAGLNYLQSVQFEGTLPTFEYRLGQATLLKQIWLEYGLNSVLVRYTYPNGPAPLELSVRPLANSRDYHATSQEPLPPYQVEADLARPGLWRVEAGPEAPPWYFQAFGEAAQWLPEAGRGPYRGFFYRQEAERGQPDPDEVLYGLGTWRVRLEPGQTVTFVASLAEPATTAALFESSRERELARQTALLETAHLPPGDDPLDRLATRLTLAADQFVVGRPDPARPGALLGDYRTVIAGYPWFSDWGRDTMIALPGLTLVTRRWPEARVILRSFAQSVSRGMLPNRFPDSAQPLGESDYNTVDASLWYFDAVDKYLAATGDTGLGVELYPVLKEIIDWHVRGTRFGIGLDEDGLLRSGEPGLQLTWMDVKIDDLVVTPRHGKPIEINALWYRACRVMEALSGRIGLAAQARPYAELAERVAAVFEQTYWYAEGGYFYDNIEPDGRPDPALRPNQAIALAVAPELVSLEKRQAALDRVRLKLLTPYGLRTLSPDDPAYTPRYTGNRVARDKAYHQGTVWPWPLGPYARAVLSLGEANRPALRALLEPFVQNLDQASCVGQVNEIFGAEPPFPPVGCVAQAWSVSELLEMWQLLA